MLHQLLVAALVVCCVSGVRHTSPVFVWSGSNALTARGAQNFEPIDAGQLVTTLDALTGVLPSGRWDTPLAAFVNVKPTHHVPEVVVFFLKSVLNTASFSRLADAYEGAGEGGLFSRLREAVRDSAASLVLPYAVCNDMFVSVVEPVMSHVRSKFGANVQVIVTRSSDDAASSLTGVTTVANNDLERTLAQSETLFSNGVPDVVVVYLHEDDMDDTQQNSFLHNINTLISKRSNGNFLALFGGNQQVLSDSMPVATLLGRKASTEVRQQGPIVTNLGPGQVYRPFNYFPTFVFAWLLVFLVLAFLFGWAIYSLSEVQVPPKLLSIAAASAKKRQ